MDTSKFITVLKKAIREVVREETKLAIREEMVLLRESLRTNNAPIVEQRKVVQPKRQEAPKPIVKKQLTKNSILNDLLNESTPFGRDAYGAAPFSFSSDDVSNFGGSAFDSMPGTAPNALVDINNNVVPIANEAVEAVANAVTRDYSALMKAINKKKGK
jgi:hypothetical protein